MLASAHVGQYDKKDIYLSFVIENHFYLTVRHALRNLSDSENLLPNTTLKKPYIITIIALPRFIIPLYVFAIKCHYTLRNCYSIFNTFYLSL